MKKTKIVLIFFLILALSPQANACTTLIVTGLSASGPMFSGWAILTKNSDTLNNPNEYPIHCPQKTFMLTYATSTETKTMQVTTYAYSGSNSYRMSGSRMPFELNTVVWGMNERGLAVAYTQLDVNHLIMNVGVADNAQGLGTRGRELCTLILALYDNVNDVLTDINNPDSPIGPNNRRNEDSISVIDRYGNGAIIEVSIEKAVWKRVINSYFAEDNIIRMWNLNPAGEAIEIKPESESGSRVTYIVDAYNQIKNNGASYREVISEVVRYVKNKEDGTTNFSINESGTWDVVNDGTSSSMVAVSGDQRYEGKLNCFWGEYGNPAIIGLYLPTIPYSAQTPENLRSYIENTVKPSTQTNGLYIPEKVRETQEKAFTAEAYTYNQYEWLLYTTIPIGLSNEQLKTNLATYTAEWQETAVTTYKTGTQPPETTNPLLLTIPLILTALILLKPKRLIK